MTKDHTDWTELREFKDVDVLKSFVLSWEFDRGVLQLDVDLFICAGHPFYEEPRPAEKACFLPAHIDFPDCEVLTEEGRSSNVSVRELARSLRGGRIDGLRRIGEGRYEIVGEFGFVTVESGRPMVRLKDLTI